jgi:hypothetical protein
VRGATRLALRRAVELPTLTCAAGCASPSAAVAAHIYGQALEKSRHLAGDPAVSP